MWLYDPAASWIVSLAVLTEVLNYSVNQYVLLKYYVDIPYAKSGVCSPFVLALFILHENLNKPNQTGPRYTWSHEKFSVEQSDFFPHPCEHTIHDTGREAKDH